MKNFLTFNLGKELFAVETPKVLEVYQLNELTEAVQGQDCFIGTMKINDFEMPIVDLFKLVHRRQESSNPKQKSIIVFQCKDLMFGVLVDQVKEIIDMATNDILASGFRPPICGVGQHSLKSVQIIDPDRLISQIDQFRMANSPKKLAS